MKKPIKRGFIRFFISFKTQAFYKHTIHCIKIVLKIKRFYKKMLINACLLKQLSHHLIYILLPVTELNNEIIDLPIHLETNRHCYPLPQ